MTKKFVVSLELNKTKPIGDDYYLKVTKIEDHLCGGGKKRKGKRDTKVCFWAGSIQVDFELHNSISKITEKFTLTFSPETGAMKSGYIFEIPVAKTVIDKKLGITFIFRISGYNYAEDEEETEYMNLINVIIFSFSSLIYLLYRCLLKERKTEKKTKLLSLIKNFFLPTIFFISLINKL